MHSITPINISKNKNYNGFANSRNNVCNSYVSFQSTFKSESSIRKQLDELYERQRVLREKIQNTANAVMKALFESLLRSCEKQIAKLEEKLFYLKR